MRNDEQPQPDRGRLLGDLAAAIGAKSRAFLERLPTAELLYLSWRKDLQQRYADPARGVFVLQWEMSAVARGEAALAEIESCASVNWSDAWSLDVGCGDGGFVVAMARRGARSHGVDLSVGNIAGANLRARAWQTTVAFAAGSAASLPYRSGSFDVVTCGDVIEHVAQPDACLREIERVLRPRGILWLAAPTRYLPANLWRDPHYHYFGVSALPRRIAAWYLVRLRHALPALNAYAVERLPKYGATVAALRRMGFEMLAGEYRPLAALRDPERVQIRWKKRLLTALLAAGLRAPLRFTYSIAAELAWPLRVACRKPGPVTRKP